MFASPGEWNNQQTIAAIVGVGIAAFGIVDFLKAAFRSVNRTGFGWIRQMVVSLTPEGDRAENVLPQADILKSLQANWAAGTDVRAQKAIAKSLVKMHLTAGNAAAVAARTNVDVEALTSIAAKIAERSASRILRNRHILPVRSHRDRASGSSLRAIRQRLQTQHAGIVRMYLPSSCADRNVESEGTILSDLRI